MTRAFVSPRKVVVVLVTALAALVGTPTGVSGQASDAPAPTAILSQDGWWNRAKGPQSGEPDNPVRSTLGGSVPAPSTVPANGLGVGAAGGDPDKVAAIGIVLEAGLDPLVDSLVLTLKETAGANGSNLNSSGAKIIACPITSFWAGVKDGDWVGRPVCDDSQAVPGARAADGTWTFDLTLLAMQWVDPTSGLDQNGVLLMESVDAPMTFQVSFEDIATGKVTTTFAATPGFGEEEFGSDEFTSFDEPVVEETFPEETFAEEPSTDFGTTFDDSASFESSGAVTGSVSAPAPVTPVADAAASDAATTSVARPIASVGLFGALPAGAIVFLLLLVLGAALLLGIVLGPLAAPTPAVVRSGGVSRALAARAAANADAKAGGLRRR